MDNHEKLGRKALRCEVHDELLKWHVTYKIPFCETCYEENKKAMLKDFEENHETIIPKSYPLLEGLKK